MQITTLHKDPARVEASWLAVGLFDGDADPPGGLAGSEAGALIGRLLVRKDLPAGLGEVTPILGAPGLAAEGLMAVGLGKRDAFDAGAAVAAGVAVARRLASKPRERIAIALPDPAGSDPALASALVEGLVVGTRGPGLRKKEPARHEFGELLVVAPESVSLGAGALEQAARRGRIVGEAVNLARDLVNTPPAEKPPAVLAGRIRAMAEAEGIEVQVWDEDRLIRERCGGLLGVSAGSDQPPALVALSYRKGGDGPTLALVGKGVTFDSGGLSLKPSASMEDMKADMTGAAVVAATMQAVARLGLPVNLLGFLGLTENLTGGRAMKLGDVLTIRDGTTVEVMNTDAEGRLILADVLSLAVEAKPDRILDLATLTGACIVALGTKIAGLFGTDDAFTAAVRAAGARTGERCWPMPLDDDFDDQLKSPVADLKNVGSKWGGAITAARFLRRFVGSTPWVHLDIAGPSWADSDSSTRDAGGTGCFVRTLVALVEDSTR